MTTTAPIFLATGRRKRSTARVRLAQGQGNIIINGRKLEEYFTTEQTRNNVLEAFEVIERPDAFDVQVMVEGGGISGQSGAVALGISRALQKMDPELRPPLKKAGLLKRDPREKERKKPGQPGARKKFQFSKR